MRHLITMLVLIAVAAVLFATASEATKDVQDPHILTYIAVVYTIGVVVMIVWTRSWSLIGCGLLATMTGDALLYGRASDHLPVPQGPWVLDMVRACFLVGGTYLIVGLMIWVRDQRRGQGEMIRDNAP